MRSLWLSLVLILACMVKQLAWADSWIDDGDFTYYCDTGSMTAGLSEYRGKSAQVTIPSTVTLNGKTYTVTWVSGAGRNGYAGRDYIGFQPAAETLEGVVLPSTIKEIDGATFTGCNRLKKVTARGEITAVGDEAFYGCSALTDPGIDFKNLACIGNDAFRGCCSLTMDVETSEKLYSDCPLNHQ